MTAINKTAIEHWCKTNKHPFSYNLAVKIIPNTHSDSYMICCHGSGANNHIADAVQSYGVKNNLISFNFPDYDNNTRNIDPRQATFGTIQELLPFIYVLKNIILQGNLSRINLYGFSAGGAVIVNTLAVLLQDIYDQDLLSIGITSQDKTRILNAVKEGIIILDAPLKSIEEIIAHRGSNYILESYAAQYKKNHLRPLDSLKNLSKLKLTILLYFELPDEILSNRDDVLFAQALKTYNQGKTYIINGSTGGHCAAHTPLWHLYQKITAQKTHTKS